MKLYHVWHAATHDDEENENLLDLWVRSCTKAVSIARAVVSSGDIEEHDILEVAEVEIDENLTVDLFCRALTNAAPVGMRMGWQSKNTVIRKWNGSRLCVVNHEVVSK